MICLLVMTDGRDDVLAETLRSAEQRLRGPISRRIIHDDTGSVDHAVSIADRYQCYEVICAKGRSGFGGAIRSAWAEVRKTSEPYLFHLEDDFTFNRTIDLLAMVDVMEHHPHLVQMALRRQPWNERERAAGGIVEADPGDFAESRWFQHRFLTHRRFYTTNPALVPRWVVDQGWPDGEQSEGRFGISLFSDPRLQAAFWGSRESGEWVTHIGAQRVGMGY